MDFDPRDRDQDVRDVEMPWVEVGQASDMARDNDDWRDRDEDTRGRDQDARQRDVDYPRDVFVDGRRECPVPRAAFHSGKPARVAKA
jgi:hypothetical protein